MKCQTTVCLVLRVFTYKKISNFFKYLMCPLPLPPPFFFKGRRTRTGPETGLHSGNTCGTVFL